MSGFGSWRIRDSGTIEHVGVFDLIGLLTTKAVRAAYVAGADSLTWPSKTIDDWLIVNTF